jgi:hypothetical protein
MTKEKETTPCYAKSPTSSRIQTPRSNDVCVYVQNSTLEHGDKALPLGHLGTDRGCVLRYRRWFWYGAVVRARSEGVAW